jgi:hypothetical protein
VLNDNITMWVCEGKHGKAYVEVKVFQNNALTFGFWETKDQKHLKKYWSTKLRILCRIIFWNSLLVY